MNHWRRWITPVFFPQHEKFQNKQSTDFTQSQKQSAYGRLTGYSWRQQSCATLRLNHIINSLITACTLHAGAPRSDPATLLVHTMSLLTLPIACLTTTNQTGLNWIRPSASHFSMSRLRRWHSSRTVSTNKLTTEPRSDLLTGGRSTQSYSAKTLLHWVSIVQTHG